MLNTSWHLPAWRKGCSAAPARASGATLIELLVGITLAAILMANAIPMFGELMTRNRLAAYSNDFLSAVYLARGEAIKRNARVVICASSDGLSCGSTDGWGEGWLVYTDGNNNAAVDTGEAIITSHGGLAENYSMTGNSTVSAYISYTGTGAPKLTGGAFQAGTITLCRQSTETTSARRIVISATGRPRVATEEISSCD